MRVIAGSAGGIPLAVPKNGMRPTMDAVRGAIFSSLGDLVIDARVLDLFAGSGALGIEALSRGANETIFVEQDRKGVQAIRENLKKARMAGVVVELDVFSWLNKGAKEGLRFELIFADPPYHKNPTMPDPAAQLLLSDKLPDLLEPKGLLVLETGKALDEALFPLWHIGKLRKYGETHVHYCFPNSGPEQD